MKKYFFPPVDKLNAIDDVSKMKLSDNAFRVYCYLVCRYNSITQQCNPSVNHMSKNIGKSKATIKRALAELRDKNLIWNYRGYPSVGSNEYKIYGTVLWKKYSSNLNESRLNNDTQIGSELSPKTIKETMKETINVQESENSELPKDSLSDSEALPKCDDTKIANTVNLEENKERITKEQFYEQFGDILGVTH